DPRRVMADRRGGDAELLQVIEATDPGIVAPDPGIVEDRRGDAELGRQIGSIDPAMRSVDDDRAPRLVADPGDAVGGQDRRHLSPLRRTTIYRRSRSIATSGLSAGGIG